MTYDMCKFERGQVWMVRFKHPESVGHEQAKDRPWLVLSVGRFNSSSGMLTAVPITTRDEVRSPSQVKFVNWYGKNNVICCEQVRTFDHSSNAYVFEFLGQVSDEVLEKVDVAISIHLGLHYSPITLKKLYDSMEAIIKSVCYMQQKADTPKFNDDDVIQFAEKLQMLADNTAHDEISATKVENFDSSSDNTRIEVKHPTSEIPTTKKTEVSTAEYKEPDIPNQETIKNVEVKTQRIKWTPELCREFIHDADTLPMKKVMDKWGIMKKTRFYSMKNYAKSLLGE